MSSRIDQLDSIRGLASTSVLAHHLFIATLATPLISMLFSKPSPLLLLINGRAAVIMFFILSGFVLSLPFLNGKKISYRTFLVKRIFRIYVPYLFAISLSMIAFHSLTFESEIDGLSEWFSSLSVGPFTLKSVLETLFLIGNYNTNRYDTVIWSLVHEMRISLIFPLLALLIVRLNWKVNLIVCFSLSLLCSLNNIFKWETSYGFQNSFACTLHYMSLFILGGLLAKHRVFLISFYTGLTRKYKYAMLFISMFCYTYGVYGLGAMKKLNLSFIGDIFGDYVISTGVILFIVVSLGSNKISNILSIKLLKFLGNISYSLYLYHIIVIVGFVHLFGGIVHMPFILLISVVVSLMIATLSYRYIELPAIQWGKKWAENKTKKSTINKKYSYN